MSERQVFTVDMELVNLAAEMAANYAAATEVQRQFREQFDDDLELDTTPDPEGRALFSKFFLNVDSCDVEYVNCPDDIEHG